jgi:hypothetical protein
MGWIFVLIAGFLGYQYAANSPTVTSGLAAMKSVASSVESVASGARQIAGDGVAELDSAVQLLPPDVKAQLGSAAVQVTSSLPIETGPQSGCGQADSLGNIKYCFDR